jgi:hypothetical protein
MGDNFAISRNEIRANAHLIAAAPELLEVLEKLIIEARIYIPTRDSKAFDTIHNAESAINKAKGK